VLKENLTAEGSLRNCERLHDWKIAAVMLLHLCYVLYLLLRVQSPSPAPLVMGSKDPQTSDGLLWSLAGISISQRPALALLELR